MNPRVLNVKYEGKYQLLLTFTNKQIKRLDLSPYLKYPVYAPLNDESFCKKVKIADGIVQWNEDIDLDPDLAFLESTPVLPAIAV